MAVTERDCIVGESWLMAEGGLQLISQPIAVAAKLRILAGQFPGPVALQVLAAGLSRADAGGVAGLGGDVAEVPPVPAGCQSSADGGLVSV